MKLTRSLATEKMPALAEVGGKAMSLILMTQAGLPVPPGFVLTVAFFQAWLESVKRTPAWTAALNSSPEDLAQHTRALQAYCMDLALDATHREALTEALASLDTDGRPRLFAVRSSSPEEDLEELSFAGGYETILGVTQEALEDALRRSFASCLDERVFVYRRNHGLAVHRLRMAVIVQQQIRAEAAGVAFSLNPANNCYDEAVISANFGLGESVVAGMASPDLFVVDKVSRTILERRVGKKETSVWLELNHEGGTYVQASPLRSQLCLSDESVLALSDMVVEVEAQYGKPVDVEWASADGLLHLLQARPVTAYFPLPEALRTAPGEPKRLYADLTLLKWGMQEPLSVMGTEHLAILNSEAMKQSLGKDIGQEVVEAFRRTLEGRTYLVLSNTIRLRGKKRYAREIREMDALASEIIAHLDEAEYVPKRLPPALRGIVVKMIRQNLGTAWSVLKALKDPMTYKQKYLEEEERFRSELTREIDSQRALSLEQFARVNMTRMLTYAKAFVPMILVSMMARSRIRRIFRDDKADLRDQIRYLDRALPQNATIQMGLEMYRLARFDDIQECTSGEIFASRLAERELSPEFLKSWDAFMNRFGFRAPAEMDPAVQRFCEQPAQFYDLLRAMADNTEAGQTPQAIYQAAEAQRERAYEALLEVAQKKGKRQARQFEKHYSILVELGGYRESSKYYVAWLTDVFRRRVMADAQPLVDAGRLDSAQEAFDLTMADLERGITDPAMDLRAQAEENTRFLRKLQRVRDLPRIVDSRGKILRGPRKRAGEGEWMGEPISPGVVRGRVKVLHRPDEKPVAPGEILVARATDPGWTPLFVNAAGIILEVGGTLQHGALVAREYGKPCVVGIEAVTEALKDGQMAELDGTHGIVRLL
jgi:phosphoenolpyruvate synthase/pyruvate phosphate dikinase